MSDDPDVLCVPLPDLAALEAFASRLAPLLQVGDALALSGDLGAGKTTLARAILAALGLEGEAPSPTFTLVQTYEPPELAAPVWHVDLYRLTRPDDALELGLEEGFATALCLIEWPERLGSWLPASALPIHLRWPQSGQSGRLAVVRLNAAWRRRFLERGLCE
jgi:tRNA threonylcarbamoyladenosine biosynthesis protein TsaE